ncbi:MAG: cupin domain-containing protein [Thermoleophilaceae bacterium]
MAEILFRRPGEGGAAGNPLGGDVAFKVRGEQSGGTLTAFETVVAPGEGPPLHIHAAEEETLYVLEGDVRFMLGDELHSGSVGSFAFVPRGMPHTFQNVGDTLARMLIHFTPSGMERFFDGVDALEAPGPDVFATLGAGVGMTVVGPPLAQLETG